MTSRRSALARLGGVAGAIGLSGCAQFLESASDSGTDLPPNPHAADLPNRQFAQTEYLPTNAAGNDLQARYRRLLFLNLDVDPSTEAARTVERGMRTIEAAYDWSTEGVFHVLGWGTAYFRRLGKLTEAPISKPQVLSRTDNPDLLEFDAVLVLESDVPSQLTAIENAMFRSRAGGTLNGEPVEHSLGDVFSIAEVRTGFLGEGLPAQHADVEGIPAGALSQDDPTFMGFFSDRQGTQASEDFVTIPDGKFAGGTTLHAAHLTQNLDTWWEGLDDAGRVARMFSPEFDPSDIPNFESNVPFSDAVRDHAREFDVVGHHEKVAQVRRDGKPLILRRDFNTTDGDHAGVHFLSFQQRLQHFRATRRAMNGWYVRDDSPAITDRENNGILNFIDVQSRANFYVPPRDKRAFPLY
ncbi:DUF7405 family protein [Haloplanus aerogenes]|uniref:Deferrochelatase/peroxidase EfeB n=1 Tax=Haloplanus aerogenes TaxID=660522 RepID=A0A3M0D963_9EURY|nr:hypothetical protein [Haloplanus aerogenes]AZH26351.1 hypothetical protein DU502_13685 [Haloplanus aerogenes]RMB18188.1 deferrochelatase/peroxidase EfeB [Haloplanus aerogenes]